VARGRIALKGILETPISGLVWVLLSRGKSALAPEDVHQDPYVFQTTIKALAVERDHRVGRVTENYAAIFVVVWFGLERNKRTSGISFEIV